MTKRSAMTMAAGLALALLVGVTAISLMLGSGSVASAGGQHKPVVKRQVQTVTVHRKADAPASGGVRVVHLGSGSAAGTYETAGYSDDDGFESEGTESGSDDGFGGSTGQTQGTFGDD
jgi:hypothetical protein